MTRLYWNSSSAPDYARCDLLRSKIQAPRGTRYKVANWTNVGKTAGRGKKCHTHTQTIPIKDIWLYPLRKNFRAILGQ